MNPKKQQRHRQHDHHYSPPPRRCTDENHRRTDQSTFPTTPHNRMLLLAHRHAAPPAHFGHRLRARDQDTTAAIQRQRVTRQEVVELGSIIPAGLLRSSLKAPASFTVRHIAEIVQRRVFVDLHSREFHTDASDSRQFRSLDVITSHFARPQQRGP